MRRLGYGKPVHYVIKSSTVTCCQLHRGMGVSHQLHVQLLGLQRPIPRPPIVGEFADLILMRCRSWLSFDPLFLWAYIQWLCMATLFRSFLFVIFDFISKCITGGKWNCFPFYLSTPELCTESWVGELRGHSFQSLLLCLKLLLIIKWCKRQLGWSEFSSDWRQF